MVVSVMIAQIVARPAAAQPACAHRLMCVRYSSAVMSPLPISSMSGSFQCPGPAYGAVGTCFSNRWRSCSPSCRRCRPSCATDCRPPARPTPTRRPGRTRTSCRRSAAPSPAARRPSSGKPAAIVVLVDLSRAAPVVLQIVDAPGRPGLRVLLLVPVAARIARRRSSVPAKSRCRSSAPSSAHSLPAPSCRETCSSIADCPRRRARLPRCRRC